MQRHPVEFHPDAAAEAQAAADWYRERSATVSEAFLVELSHAIEQIENTPIVGPCMLREPDVICFIGSPFSVVYRVESDSIKVIAVAHARRRPGHWQSR